MSAWQPVETAPQGASVITYGKTGIRFMRKRETGQWENMMHLPREAPTHWMPLPEPPPR